MSTHWSGRAVRSTARLAAFGVAAALLISGCASDGGGSANGSSSSAAAIGAFGVSDGGDPVDGGAITFSSYGFPSSLDPTVTPAAGFTGGTEMAAIYDTLVRTDMGSSEFEPQLAESLSSNEDFTEFTITLREDAKFSDGSPVDAAAVKWSIDRFVAAQADVAQEWSNAVAAIATPDERTVVFTLAESWSHFPVLLAMGPGMIVAKSSDAGEKFSPIGAGPFTVSKFAPDEELLLAARDDYFAGRPHLDTVRFVPGNGARTQLESLVSGQLDMAFIYRDDAVIQEAQDKGFSGYLDVSGLGTIGIINNRDGRPGADVRVRKAIAHGIDPQLIDERANDGRGLVGSTILPETSRWDAGAEGLAFDPELATALLNEAKADGFDGDLAYLATAEPAAEAAALAVQASLNSVGFNVTIEYATSVTELVRKLYVDQDFDLTRSGDGLLDETPYLRLYSSLGSDSRNNASGYADPEMDALLLQVKSASSDEEMKTALAEVQRRANETAPYAVWGPSRVLVVWDGDIHGVQRSIDNIMLLGSAWIARD